MKALWKDNFIIFEANKIEFGIWDEPDVEKWALFDANDNIMYYALNDNYEVIDFDESKKPEDYIPGKYFYIDGEFVENPDWQPPLPSIDEQVQMLGEGVAELGDDVSQVAANVDFLAMELGIDMDQ